SGKNTSEKVATHIQYVLDEHHDGYPDENDSDIEQEPQSSSQSISLIK
ncbi:24850_t:CDS:2, partial [Entrophospora sp. SA101]